MVTWHNKKYPDLEIKSVYEHLKPGKIEVIVLDKGPAANCQPPYKSYAEVVHLEKEGWYEVETQVGV